MMERFTIKSLFLIDDTLENKISYYHLMLMMAMLPFDLFFSHILFISFALHTLIYLKKEMLKTLFTLRNLLLQSIFLVTLAGCSYTSYSKQAGIDLSRQLMILLFPVFIALTNLNLNKYRDNLLHLFSWVCVGTICYLYLHAFYLIHYFRIPMNALFSGLFINHKFSAPINIHATFLSLQIAVALFYMLYRLIKQHQGVQKWISLFGAIVLFAGIVQLGSKAVIAVVLVGIIAILPYLMLPKVKRLKYIMVAGAALVVIIATVLTINSFRQRYVGGLEADLSDSSNYETVEPRIVRWKAALEVADHKLITGYGTGAEIPVLSDQYFDQKLYVSYLYHLNAHNQYLSFLLTTGIIGLIIYIITLTWGIKSAIKQRDMVFVMFMLLLITVSFSESILNAEKGIIFYSLFFSFFIFSMPDIAGKGILKINEK